LTSSDTDGVNLFDLDAIEMSYRRHLEFYQEDIAPDETRAHLETVLRTYAPGGLFHPLGLIEWDPEQPLGGSARKKRPYHLPLRLVVFAIVSTYAKWMGGPAPLLDDGRITLNFLAYAEGSPGPIFMLPRDLVYEVATKLRDLTDVACSEQHGSDRGALFDYYPHVEHDPYTGLYNVENQGCIKVDANRRQRLGDAFWENMYLLYLAPPHVTGPPHAFRHPTFV